MSTGACGIDCGVCRLHHEGLCSTCGAGTSDVGKEKLAAQLRLLGGGCPMLECAVSRRVAYCLRDCDEFPCERARLGGHPFGELFLDTQARRRAESGGRLQAAWPPASEEFWTRAAARDGSDLATFAGATPSDGGHRRLQCLHETWLIDLEGRRIEKIRGEFGGEFDRQIPFLMLVYLATVNIERAGEELTAPAELYGGVNPLATGRFAVKTADVESTFGRDADLLRDAAKRLGGRPTNKADASALFHLFPRLPVEVLLWTADEEFPAEVKVHLDRTLPAFYPVDATATLINLLLGRLVLVAA